MPGLSSRSVVRHVEQGAAPPHPPRTRCRDRLAEHRYGTRPVIPIVTPEEMRAIDAAAPEPVEVLIERAGAAVARAARRMLGGTYGRRVVVVAGKGNNGNDGRAAAGLLQAWGMQVGRARRRRRPPAWSRPAIS